MPAQTRTSTRTSGIPSTSQPFTRSISSPELIAPQAALVARHPGTVQVTSQDRTHSAHRDPGWLLLQALNTFLLAWLAWVIQCPVFSIIGWVINFADVAAAFLPVVFFLFDYCAHLLGSMWAMLIVYMSIRQGILGLPFLDEGLRGRYDALEDAAECVVWFSTLSLLWTLLRRVAFTF